MDSGGLRAALLHGLSAADRRLVHADVDEKKGVPLRTEISDQRHSLFMSSAFGRTPLQSVSRVKGFSTTLIP